MPGNCSYLKPYLNLQKYMVANNIFEIKPGEFGDKKLIPFFK